MAVCSRVLNVLLLQALVYRIVVLEIEIVYSGWDGSSQVAHISVLESGL